MQVKSDGTVVGICTNNTVPGDVPSAKKIIGTTANVLTFQVKPLSTSFTGNSPLSPVNCVIADTTGVVRSSDVWCELGEV